MVAQQQSTASKVNSALGGGIGGFGIGALVGLAALGLGGAVVGAALIGGATAATVGALGAVLLGAPIVGITAGAFGLKGAFSGAAKADSDEAKYQRQKELYASIEQENLGMVAEQNQALGAQMALAQAAPLIYQQAKQDAIRQLVAMGPKNSGQGFVAGCGCEKKASHEQAALDSQAAAANAQLGQGA